MGKLYARTIEVGDTPAVLVFNEYQGSTRTVQVKPRTRNVNIGDADVSPDSGWFLTGPETLTLGPNTGLWAVTTDSNPGQVDILVS